MKTNAPAMIAAALVLTSPATLAAVAALAADGTAGEPPPPIVTVLHCGHWPDS